MNTVNMKKIRQTTKKDGTYTQKNLETRQRCVCLKSCPLSLRNWALMPSFLQLWSPELFGTFPQITTSSMTSKTASLQLVTQHSLSISTVRYKLIQGLEHWPKLISSPSPGIYHQKLKQMSATWMRNWNQDQYKNFKYSSICQITSTIY